MYSLAIENMIVCLILVFVLLYIYIYTHAHTQELINSLDILG
jgi:hypothetical protein